MSNLHTGSLITPVILAGGMGTRLISYSTPSTPKQFGINSAGKSLFQKTIERVQNRSLFYAPLITSTVHHKDFIKDQAHYNHTMLYEPVARNTAAAVVIGALRLLEKGRDKALILPSDHVINDTHAFHHAIQLAMHHIHGHDEHILFGIHPTSPSPELGYIQTNNFGNVTCFHEKPSETIARELLHSSPHTYWNSGIFVLNLPLMLKHLETIAPTFLTRCEVAHANPTQDNYSAIPTLPFDKLYLEYSPSLFCIEAPFDWMDIGMKPALLQAAS